MDPPRSIPNRVVKRGSAAGTGAAALGDKVRAPLSTCKKTPLEIPVGFLFDNAESIYYHLHAT